LFAASVAAPVPPFATFNFSPSKSAAGNVINTSFVPALRLTTEPALLDASIVVRAIVLVPEYVPRPTSHSSAV
jgi:hypothetical protein